MALTQQEFRNRLANPSFRARVNQAQSLIARGKSWVAYADPKLKGIVDLLQREHDAMLNLEINKEQLKTSTQTTSNQPKTAEQVRQEFLRKITTPEQRTKAQKITSAITQKSYSSYYPDISQRNIQIQTPEQNKISEDFNKQKQNIINQREKRIQNLITKNKNIGVLTDYDSARRVILAREQSEIKNLKTKVYGPTTGEVIPAPTIKEKYKKEVDKSGYIKGSIGFVGGYGASKVDYWQQKTGNYYQQEAIQKSAEVAPQSLYFTPYVGGALLVGGGVEELVTKAGRKRIQEQSLYFQGKGLSPITSNVVSYGIPVSEIAIGGNVLRGEISSLKNTRIAKALEKEPTKIIVARVEGKGGGVDFIYGYKKTTPTWFEKNILRIKPTEQITKITQPYYLAKGREVLEGGKGIVITKIGKNVRFSSFDASGVGKSFGKLKIGKGYTSIKTDLKGGGGFINIKEKVSGSGTLKKEVDFISGKPIYSYKPKIYMGKEKIRKLFLGGSKTGENNIIKIVSGEAKTGVLETKTGKVSLKGGIEEYGYIKKFNAKDFSVSSNDIIGSVSSSKTKSILKKETITSPYQITAIKTAETLNLPKPKPVTKIAPLEIKPQIKTESIYSGTGQYEIQETQSMIKPSLISKQDLNQKPSQITKSSLSEKFLQKNILETKQSQPQKQQEKQIQILSTKQKSTTSQKQQGALKLMQTQKQKQKQKQKIVNTFKNILIGNEKKLPKRIIPPIILSKKQPTRVSSKDSIDSFEVFLTKAGKEFSIGKTKTKKEAEKLLKEKIIGTLSASGLIEKKGFGKLRATELEGFGGEEFRISKTSPFKIVEKKSKRLRKGTTGKEIQFFKK